MSLTLLGKSPIFSTKKKNVCSPIAVIATGALCGWMAFGETQRMGGDKPGKVPPASSICDLLISPQIGGHVYTTEKVTLKKTPLKKVTWKNLALIPKYIDEYMSFSSSYLEKQTIFPASYMS